MSFISHIKEEFQVIQERDPAIKTPLKCCYIRALGDDQIQTGTQIISERSLLSGTVDLSQRAARKTGIEIHPGATIEKDCSLTMEAVWIIGETTIIGDNVTLYQGVTLGGTEKKPASVTRLWKTTLW